MKVSTIQLLAALVVAVTNNGAVVHAVSSSLKRSKRNAAVERKTRSNGGGNGGKGKGGKGKGNKFFNRVSSFYVCSQIDPTCNDDTETVAEIVTASEDGMTAIYSDSEKQVLGFVDISDEFNPMAMGEVALPGEPTSVSVCGNYAIVGVNTSPDFVNPSGEWVAVNIATQTIAASGDLGGQPDSVAVSPDCTKAAVAIENERDEDLGDGEIPQAPAGFLVIVDISAADPTMWTTSQVDLTGLPGVFEAGDPEPEFVDINEDNVAVVTLQENNAIVLVDLATGMVTASFSAGTVDLTNIDVDEEGIIDPSASQAAVPREPDGVAWIGTKYFATANEGDMLGGSRGFSIFDTAGNVVYESSNLLDLLTIAIGHYPDERSGNKGNEPENIVYGEYGGEKLLFVNSERSSVVFVFDVSDVEEPELKQILPAGVAPEGGKAIPSRDLLLVASEADDRGDKIRSIINIYKRDYKEKDVVYPFIVSDPGEDGTPIPFSALSALATIKCVDDRRRALRQYAGSRRLNGNGKGKGGKGSCKKDIFYAVDDSFYSKNRILAIDAEESPAVVFKEMLITDKDGVFAAAATAAGLPVGGVPGDLVNDDMTVNIDPEGLDTSEMGGFWLAHEGSGTQGDAARPFETPNILFKLSEEANIEQVILPPQGIIDNQLRFGYEGVAEAADMDMVVVTFQRALSIDPNPRLGVWSLPSGGWTYYYYPLDAPESQNGGWVGLSDITYVGDGEFYIVERDNQGGPDAAIKKIYSVTLSGPGAPYPDTPPTVTKTLVYDLLPDLKTVTNGPVLEKIEGMTLDQDGDIWINNDNDGVDDNNGEQVLLEIKLPKDDCDRR